ncbi:MAG: TlpA family protein disulfide reductase [Chitinophagaceae bacterium]|nr:MAG: TlpA family protein disulfide reductase [Chitinophagaceae bacterium]
MKSKILCTLTFICACLFLNAQDNFTYSPAKPQPGDIIKFSYTPAGDLAGNNKALEAFVLSMNTKQPEIVDIKVARNAGKWEGEFKTDTSAKLIAFGFKIDKNFDNNKDNGYLVPLFNGDQIVPQGNYAAFQIYQMYGEELLGIKADAAKATAYLDKEKAAYPANFNEKYLNTYLSNLLRNDNAKGTAAIQKEIENTFKAGLETEASLNKLSSYYAMLRLQQQMNYFNKLKAEKFPSKSKGIMEYYNEFRGTTDLDKKTSIYNQLMTDNTIKSDPSFESFSQFLMSQLSTELIHKGDTKGFEALTKNISDNKTLAQLYNSAAWASYEKGTDLNFAEKLAKQATSIAKAELLKPTGKKPSLVTAKQWAEERGSTYASYADTYASILYKLGKYKAALPFATDAAIKYNDGKNTNINETYAKIAEKVLPASKFKSIVEGFVKAGAANAFTIEKLKNLFIKQGGTEQGFSNYLSNLEKEATLKLIEELKAGMISVASPKFSLKNLDGTTVSLESLKGKTVIVDFWATWCGPCKASFPAMQKMVNKYKDDANVKFVFVNTWENVDNKHKNAQDFIKSMNYTFDVLLDAEDAMAKSFQKSFPSFTGIPTKFFIDKTGTVRYMSVGFGGEEKTIKEVDAIIDILK